MSVAHNGVRETLNCLRQQFWLPKAKNFIRKIIYECRTCRRYEGKPYCYPSPPPLPTSRVSPTHAFDSVGLDYAGPLFIKNIYPIDNNDPLFKSWISLFTCATTRAIHLDLAVDCSASSCIRVLQRFISRRGTPKLIISDNGTNFISADVQSYAAEHNISWKFNLASAPWQGGFFERLVQSVKRCLKKLIGHSRLTFEELLSVLYEIEMILNNRPLTFVYNELTHEPLTPNHLIYGRQLSYRNMHPNIESNVVTTENRAKHINVIIEQFWKQWTKEYLTSLREYSTKKYRNNRNREISINDVVLIMDDRIPRQRWKYGKIINLFDSTDSKIRGALVNIFSNGRLIEIHRPINKLIPVEHSVEANGKSIVDNDILCDSKNDVGIRFVDEKDVEVFS